MPYDDPTLKEFAGYFEAKEPGRRERADAWATAIGLQKVDGLSTSRFLVETAKAHIEGRITQAQARRRIRDYYAAKDETASPDSELEEPDKVAERIVAVINDGGFAFTPEYFISIHKKLFSGVLSSAYEQGVKRDWGYLEKFFRNLLLNETHELKSRYLLIGLTPEKQLGRKNSSAQSQNGGQKKAVEKGGQKRWSEKGGQKTRDRLIGLLVSNPHLTREGLSSALGICPSAVQKHLARLRKDNRLRRIGPDKGGHWEVLVP